MWEDDDAYYSAKMLAYEPDLPPHLVYPRGKPGADGTVSFTDRTTVDEHFALVNHQLAQLRDAMALARALGRVLVLPRLVCGLDRWWAPHSGIIPGSATRLPLLECPADHVIDLERIGKPEAVLREASVLCNPRTPPAVLNGIKRIELPPHSTTGGAAVAAERADSRDDAACGGGSVAGLVEKLKSQHAGASVLELSGPLPAYREVLPAADVRAFEDEMRRYGALWCCNTPPGGRGAGHIHYDLLWDVLPHTDKFQRTFTRQSPWRPIMGP